jgi:hypothetical protein
MTKLYKITGMDGEAINGGKVLYHQPRNGEPGKWMPFKPARVCVSGYHLIPASAIIDWFPYLGILWEAEGRGTESGSRSTMIAFAQARLAKKVGILDNVVHRRIDHERWEEMGENVSDTRIVLAQARKRLRELGG